MIRDKNLLLVPQYINGEGNITLCIQMDYPKHVYTISMEHLFCIEMRSLSKYL